MRVQFIQKQEQVQKLSLTPAMRQSLECLQLSALDLLQYVQEAALENPMLEVELPSLSSVSLDSQAAHETTITEHETWDDCFARRKEPSAEQDALSTLSSGDEDSLRDHLLAQLGQTALIDEQLEPVCRFLIDCLDSRGYLDCPLEALADETGLSLFLLEQALFAIQMLDPPGVGARSLSECLILQLSQGEHFSALTLGLARDGLEQIAKKQYSELAKRFHTDRKTILAAVAVISQLNPIPAQGFGSRESSSFVVPDAFIYSQNDSVTIELNKRALPRISVDEHYHIMLDSADNAELRDYLRQKLRQANDMIQGIQGRGQTLRRLLRYIADYQHAFFCGGELRTMTIQSAAEALEINPSTVSRAVQDKYIQFGGKVIPLRELFSSSVTYGEDGALSSVAIKQRLRVMIQSEDPSHPMSDEELAAALANDHIEISRRTVAKYRSQLQIPPASARRTRT